MELTIIQTCDAVRFPPVLAATGRTVELYCKLHSYRYLRYVGLKRGSAPVHATYNRVYLLQELFEQGYRGWALYVDSDAFVRDFTFDCTRYLYENQRYSFIAADAIETATQPWMINAGIYFLNLGSNVGQAILHLYHHAISTLIPQDYWDNPEAIRIHEFCDQTLLWRVLMHFGSDIKVEPRGLINYEGSFIAQVLEAAIPDFDQRVELINKRCDRVLSDFYSSIKLILNSEKTHSEEEAHLIQPQQ
jgi:hypothetical protein